MTWDNVRTFMYGCVVEVLYQLGRPIIYVVDKVRRKR